MAVLLAAEEGILAENCKRWFAVAAAFLAASSVVGILAVAVERVRFAPEELFGLLLGSVLDILAVERLVVDTVH